MSAARARPRASIVVDRQALQPAPDALVAAEVGARGDRAAMAGCAPLVSARTIAGTSQLAGRL
jgi:hypothetical protein